MNDSFLEDLNLLPKSTKTSTAINKSINQFITTRSPLTCESNKPSKASEYDNFVRKEDKIISSSTSSLKNIRSRRSGSHDSPKQQKNLEIKKPLSSTPKSKNSFEDYENSGEKQTLKDKKLLNKIQDGKSILLDRMSSNISSNYSQYSNATSKENSHPSIDAFKESKAEKNITPEIKIDDQSQSKILMKASGCSDSIELLQEIKKLVSINTEQETNKVLKAMENLHFNSQSNLIKHLMLQTDDLIKELSINKNTSSIKSLLEENEKLREDNFILRARNEMLQKKVDEAALIKEENISLKLKIKDLQK